MKRQLKEWNISNTDFVRTTDKKHAKAAQEIFRKVFDKGLVYHDAYEGLYCTGCEAYYTEKDLVGGKCPHHGTAPEKMKEDAYFFKLSNFKEKILELLEKTDFIQPPVRKNEIVARIRESGLRDLCVTRANSKWGIRCPVDKRYVLYVWFDALLNYVTALETGSKKFRKYWPADVHVIGKDIVWFHAVVWPAILMASDIKLPKKLLVHGFINTDSGAKMSKSTGNALSPDDVLREFPLDAARYFLVRESSFTQDIGFSLELLKERHNNELANGLGNLLNRTLSMIEKYSDGFVPRASGDKKLQEKLRLKEIETHLDSLELNQALNKTFAFVNECNSYVNERLPWKQSGKDRAVTLYTLADSLRLVSILLFPFMPDASLRISEQLNVKQGSWKKCRFNLLKAGTKVNRKEVLFKKIE